MQKYHIDPCRRSLTAARTMSILEILNRPGPARVSDIVRQGSLSRGAVCRILNTLESEGYVTREQSEKTYRLTRRVMNLSIGYGIEDVVANTSSSVISELSRKIVWPINLTIPRGSDIETLATTEHGNPFAISHSRVGGRTPIVRTATGCAILAAADQKLRDTYFNVIEQSGVFVEILEEFKSRVQMARREKFATYHADGAKEASVAVAIVSSGKPVVGLGVKYIASAVSYSSLLKDIVPLLFEAARQIESNDEWGEL